MEFSGALGDLPFIDLFQPYNVIQKSDLSIDGMAEFSEASFLSEPELLRKQNPDNLILATLFFTIDTRPTFTLAATQVNNNDFGFEFIWGPKNEVIGKNSTKIFPNPVPEPATFLLLSAGLAGLAGFGRRKLKTKT